MDLLGRYIFDNIGERDKVKYYIFKGEIVKVIIKVGGFKNIFFRNWY